MSEYTSFLAEKKILVVDDELDVLDSIEEILDEAIVDKASDFQTAANKLDSIKYDFAILDVMGVDGLRLLDICVKKGIPAAMLTAHAMNLQTFQASIEKGAVSFLPKEKMSNLYRFINDLIQAIESGKEPWKILFDELSIYFDEKFGPEWKYEDKAFWDEFAHVIKTRFGAAHTRSEED